MIERLEASNEWLTGKRSEFEVQLELRSWRLEGGSNTPARATQIAAVRSKQKTMSGGGRRRRWGSEMTWHCSGGTRGTACEAAVMMRVSAL